MTKKIAKVLSDQQVKFLDALFGEAQGKAVVAKRIAGYSENYNTGELIKSLKDEIIEMAHLTLATHAGQAAFELINVMINPNESGAAIKLKAVESLLDRAGVNAPKEQDLKLDVPASGLFILPAKLPSGFNHERSGYNPSDQEGVMIDVTPNSNDTEEEAA